MNIRLEKTIVLVGIYNQQFQGTIFLMVFDFQGFSKLMILFEDIFHTWIFDRYLKKYALWESVFSAVNPW